MKMKTIPFAVACVAGCLDLSASPVRISTQPVDTEGAAALISGGTPDFVSVESSEASLAAGAAFGVWSTDGVATFTAPGPVSAAGTTYVCTGCLIEVWNAEQREWSAPSVSPDLSYAYSGSGCVRLTWQWEMTSGMRLIDTGSYVQNGLVAHYDGLRNAGADLPHDTSATTWKNLGSNGIDADVITFADGGSFWTEAGYWFSSSGSVQTASAFDLGRRFAIQMVCDYEGWMQPSLTGNNLVRPICSENLNLSVYRWQGTADDAITFNADKLMGKTGVRPAISQWGGEWLNVAIDYEKGAAFETVAPGTWKVGDSTSSTFTPIGSTKFVWGGDPSKPSTALSRGIVYAVRFYDRLLTNAQYARNRMVDDIRYHNAYPAAGVVSVRSSVAGAESSLGVGDYETAGAGPWTFTVPSSIAVGDREYAAAGYRLEDWEAATSNWVSGVVHEGTSYIHSGTATRRITWLWTATKGIKSAYTIDDYVQDGLVLHVDGIQNAGRTLPHVGNNGYNIWQDLTERRNTFIYAVNQPGTNEVYDMTGEGWTDNGFTYVGKYRSILSTAFTPGSNMTVETVLDFKKSNMLADTAAVNLWSPKDDYGVFYRKSNSSANFKMESWTGQATATRSVAAMGDSLSYCTSVLSDDYTHVFNVTNYLSRASGVGKMDRLAKKTMEPLKWALGGANYIGNLYNKNTREKDLANLTIRAPRATYHAFRVYNRPLSEAELAHNRAVDAARFHGAGLAETNVVVASSQAGVEAAEASGAYIVEGRWNFTAREVSVPGGGADDKWRPVGYWLDTLNDGAWTGHDYVSGTNYLHVTASHSAPVRITWKWRYGPQRGALLVFR